MLNHQSVRTAPSKWKPEQVALIDQQNIPEIALIDAGDVQPVIPGLFLWDMWPMQLADGATAKIDGWTPWLVLSASADIKPIQRHERARIRLILERDGVWRDCGDLMPNGFSPGSREWAGSALFAPDTGCLTLFWTAAGRKSDAFTTYEQRLFKASAILSFEFGQVRFANWSEPMEIAPNDGVIYEMATQREGAPGEIFGYRDPAFFTDPADDRSYILFTGSRANSVHSHAGVIGIATALDNELNDWELMPELLSADGLNNELERPHMIHFEGLYYLFWSTQRHVFSPEGPSGPSGLYGMTSPSLFGDFEPLNGTGLVAANPVAEPTQAFSWWVTKDLEVASFVDYWGMHGETLETQPERERSHFGGVPAPRFSIELDGRTARLTRR